MQGKRALEMIQKEAERLNPQEQLTLVERIIHKLKETHIAEKKPLDWNELYGLGKGLWNGEDAQEYVNKMRENRA